MRTEWFLHSNFMFFGLVIGLLALPWAKSWAGGAPHSYSFSNAMKASAMSKTNSNSASSLNSQSSKNAWSNSKPDSSSGGESGLSGSLSLGYSQSLLDYHDGQKSTSTDGMVSLSGALSPNWRLGGELGFQQNLKDAEDTDNGISDLSLSLKNRSHELASWLSGRWSIFGDYPLSDKSVKLLNFQGSLGTSYSFSLADLVLPKGWDLYASFGGTRYFYKYETDTAGDVLDPYSLSESLGVSYGIRRWSFSTSFRHAHYFSYAGNVTETFRHKESITYTIQPDRWSVTAGHRNSGSWLKSNDQDSNVDFVNDDNSIVYAETEISF